MNRNIALDFLKIALAFMVVGLHAGFLSSTTPMGSYLTVNGIFRIAVPIFLLIGGFYFYTAIAKGKAAYWIKRVLYLYIFWMLFYSYFWFNTELTLWWFIVSIAIGYYHLWYLPGLLGAAILVALLKDLPKKIAISAILVTYIIGVAIQYSGNYHFFENTDLDQWFNYNFTHRNFIFFAFPFFFTGFLIRKFEIHKKISLKSSIILTCIGFLLLITESFLNYTNPLMNGSFDNFASLLFVCPAVFILFLNLNYQGVSKELALYSTGVYFVHILFLITYNKMSIFNDAMLTIVVIISSIIATYFLMKINKIFKFIL